MTKIQSNFLRTYHYWKIKSNLYIHDVCLLIGVTYWYVIVLNDWSVHKWISVKFLCVMCVRVLLFFFVLIEIESKII